VPKDSYCRENVSPVLPSKKIDLVSQSAGISGIRCSGNIRRETHNGGVYGNLHRMLLEEGGEALKCFSCRKCQCPKQDAAEVAHSEFTALLRYFIVTMLVYSIKPFGWLTGGVLHVATPLMAAQIFLLLSLSDVFYLFDSSLSTTSLMIRLDIPLMYKHNHFFSFLSFYHVLLYTYVHNIRVILRLIPLMLSSL